MRLQRRSLWWLLLEVGQVLLLVLVQVLPLAPLERGPQLEPLVLRQQLAWLRWHRRNPLRQWLVSSPHCASTVR